MEMTERKAPVAERVVKQDGRKTRGTREGSLVEHVRRLILEDIIRGRIRPGTMLQLSEIADDYEVSRTPVREALALLERQGLVSAVPYKGYLVKGIEPGDVRDVYLIRKVIEGAATELATSRIPRESLERLHGVRPAQVDQMTLEYDEYAHDFHQTIIHAAASPRLLSIFEDVYNDVRRIQYAGIGNPRPDLIHAEHQAIVEAMLDGDSALARARMEAHIDAIRTRALQSWVDDH
jgi:DNA-binding GntR family transcriptional regulator